MRSPTRQPTQNDWKISDKHSKLFTAHPSRLDPLRSEFLSHFSQQDYATLKTYDNPPQSAATLAQICLQLFAAFDPKIPLTKQAQLREDPWPLFKLRLLKLTFPEYQKYFELLAYLAVERKIPQQYFRGVLDRLQSNELKQQSVQFSCPAATGLLLFVRKVYQYGVTVASDGLPLPQWVVDQLSLVEEPTPNEEVLGRVFVYLLNCVDATGIDMSWQGFQQCLKDNELQKRV